MLTIFIHQQKINIRISCPSHGFCLQKTIDVAQVLSISDTEVYIPGYIIIRKDRSRSGGGVALYIRENLSYTNRIDLVPDALEMICVEINLPHSRSFLVSTWYRPPSAEMQLFDEYEKFVQSCDIEHKQLILTGDINSDYEKTPPDVHTRTLRFISSVYQLE